MPCPYPHPHPSPYQAAVHLERSVAMVDAALTETARDREQQQTADPPRGTYAGPTGGYDLSGYTPLSVIRRLNGDDGGALDIAERCIGLISSAFPSGVLGANAIITLGRCHAARAQALYKFSDGEAQRSMAAAIAAAGFDGGVAEMARQLFGAIPAHRRLPETELLRRRSPEEVAAAMGLVAELRRSRAEIAGGAGTRDRREAADGHTDTQREHADGGAGAARSQQHRAVPRASSFEQRITDARRRAPS